jgi:hypothetical protein
MSSAAPNLQSWCHLYHGVGREASYRPAGAFEGTDPGHVLCLPPLGAERSVSDWVWAQPRGQRTCAKLGLCIANDTASGGESVPPEAGPGARAAPGRRHPQDHPPGPAVPLGATPDQLRRRPTRRRHRPTRHRTAASAKPANPKRCNSTPTGNGGPSPPHAGHGSKQTVGLSLTLRRLPSRYVSAQPQRPRLSISKRS